MWRWVRRMIIGLTAALVLLYLGDWVVYRLRGSPQGTVSVTHTVAVPLKNNKTEYDYLGVSDEPCSVSLFSQGGETPCWQLRRNQNQSTKI